MNRHRKQVLMWLKSVGADEEPTIFIEVGVGSAETSCLAMKFYPNLTAHLVDHWTKIRKDGDPVHSRWQEVALKATEAYVETGQCKIHEMASVEAAKLFEPE